MTPHLPLGLPPAEIALLEVFNVGRVDGPVVALSVGGATRLNEAVIEAEVMTDGVSPAWSSVSEVRVIIEDPLVNVSKNQLIILRFQDGHGY